MNDAAPAIKNVFVLMLENHSFDNIFCDVRDPGDSGRHHGVGAPTIGNFLGLNRVFSRLV